MVDFSKIKKFFGKGEVPLKREFEDESGLYQYASADDFESYDEVDSAGVEKFTEEELEAGGEN